MTRAHTNSLKRDSDQSTASGFFDEAPLERWWCGWHVVELLGVFLLGMAIVAFLYTQPGQPKEEWGVPGHDAFYHVKMAVLMPEIGLPDRFPWLQATIFWKDRFVSHHWGFHAYLVPFVHAAHALGYEYYVGAKWAMMLCFGGVLALFTLLLMIERMPFRWLWIGLFLAMPDQFFTRHCMIRAIDPSLFCMLLLILFMFRRRYVAAGLTVAAFIHVYMGGLIYAPILVGTYFLGGLLSPRGDRVSWKLPVWTFAGWLVGLLTHPYARGALPFLRVQIFGTGLTPDIPVGNEWKPYEGTLWWFAVFTYPMGVTLAAAVCLRLRSGLRIGPKEWSMLLVSFAFLVLMCKARRFVEYWPIFCLLASAYLAAPLLRTALPDLWTPEADRKDPDLRVTVGVATVLLAIGLGIIGWYRLGHLGIETLIAEWQVWLLVGAVYFLAPVGRWLTLTHPPRSGRAARLAVLGTAVLMGGLFVSLSYAVLRAAYWDKGLGSPLLPMSAWLWIGAGALYGVAVTVGLHWRNRDAERPAGRAWMAVSILACGFGYATILFLTCAAQLTELQKSVRCGYDLPATQRAMTWLKANSAPGSVVFTDDWDIFPLHFYHNHHNYYIVGLDPKFTDEIETVGSELWQRYVKLSRGQFPSEIIVTRPDDQGRMREVVDMVTIDDFTRVFGCRYVITDRDHDTLARKLEQSPSHARRVWPVEGSIDDSGSPPYKIFQLLEPASVSQEGQAHARVPRSVPQLSQEST